jgi:hypothetical protein
MWFVVPDSFSVRLIAYGSWVILPITGEIQMQTDHVRACIDALKGLYQEKHKELGTSVAEELKAVIEAFEDCLQEGEREVEVAPGIMHRAIEVLAEALKLATNIVELIHAFFDSQ